MALEFIRRRGGSPERAAIFPGTWNPPTVAHLEVARAALIFADEVIWVLPRAFPHKPFEWPGPDDRRRMLELVTSAERGFSAAISDSGFYAGIAEEAREFFGPNTEIALVCGRDAAERIATWNYDKPDVFDDLVARHPLLVAARAGDYQAPEKHVDRIIRLPLPRSFDDVSSSEVRRLIALRHPWQHLVPPAIVNLVADVYSAKSGPFASLPDERRS